MHSFRIVSLTCVVATCLLSSRIYAEESSAEQQLDAIIEEHWDYSLAESPTFATAVGVNDYNDRMPSVTREDQLRRLAVEQAFLRRVRDIESDSLSVAGLANLDVFQWVLEDSIGAYELNLSRIPFNTFSGFFMNALSASDSVAMSSVADYEDYIARLADIPRYFAENIDNMRAGVASGFVLPQIVIDGVLPTIEAQVKDSPEESSFFEQFAEMSDRLSSTKALTIMRSISNATRR